MQYHLSDGYVMTVSRSRTVNPLPDRVEVLTRKLIGVDAHHNNIYRTDRMTPDEFARSEWANRATRRHLLSNTEASDPALVSNNNTNGASPDSLR